MSELTLDVIVSAIKADKIAFVQDATDHVCCQIGSHVLPFDDESDGYESVSSYLESNPVEKIAEKLLVAICDEPGELSQMDKTFILEEENKMLSTDEKSAVETAYKIILNTVKSSKTMTKDETAALKRAAELLYSVTDAKEKSGEPANKITREMLERAYNLGIVKITDSPNDDGAVCTIGDDWFYFGGLTAEEHSADEYVAVVPKEDIIDEILTVLDEFYHEGDGFDDEYEYCYLYITEKLAARAEQKEA